MAREISQVKAPATRGIEDKITERAIQHIVDEINRLIEAVNLKQTVLEQKESDGSEGNIRLASREGVYYIQGRTKDGWAETAALTLVEKE
ncbi:MAG: hypothetical protein HN932_13020 [Candidatus Marinimicrobia bacterium]|jgi:hypothetical protein|nr:hypothetical protein [Candidatus Neomarinimicrobiota bacterium]MBT7339075.1 hypothetical protein [Candidatus Jacksonbacteria bacterium]